MNINDLRSHLKSRERAVGKKISRIKSVTGLELSGSAIDPRKGASNVSRMNRRQLNSALKKAEAFMDRRTQYVASAYKTPIPVADWKRYDKAQQLNVKMALSRLAEVQHLPIPSMVDGRAQSIIERLEGITPTRPGMGKRAINVVHNPPIRKPGSITSMKALKELTLNMEKQTSPNYVLNRLKKDRASFRKALKEVGRDDLLKKLRGLTTKQFNTVWQYTDLPGAVFSQYSAMKASEKGESDGRTFDPNDGTFTEIEEHLEWAKKL